MSEAVFITLNESDFQRLVAGNSVVIEHRNGLHIEVKMRGIGSRQMIHAVLSFVDSLLDIREKTTPEPDPPEAQELIAGHTSPRLMRRQPPGKGK